MASYVFSFSAALASAEYDHWLPCVANEQLDLAMLGVVGQLDQQTAAAGHRLTSVEGSEVS